MRSFLCAVAFTVLVVPGFGQTAPKVEVFGGFSYLSYEALSVNLPSGSVTENCPSSSSGNCQVTPDPTPTVNFTPRFGLYGWNGSATAVLTPWFGFTTDFSGNYTNATDSTTVTQTVTYSPCGSDCTSINTVQYSVSASRIYTFMFGPQFTFPTGKVKAYSRFLVGGMNKEVSISETVTSSPGGLVTLTEFAQPTSPGIAFALAFGGGIDYPIRKKMSWRTGVDYLTSTGTPQNHLRVYTGAVWKLGK